MAKNISAIDKCRERFNPTEQVKINTSSAHLSFLKSIFLKPIQQEVEIEKTRKKKPATKAYAEISKLSEKELNVWLTESAIRHVVSEYVTTKIKTQSKKSE